MGIATSVGTGEFAKAMQQAGQDAASYMPWQAKDALTAEACRKFLTSNASALEGFGGRVEGEFKVGDRVKVTDGGAASAKVPNGTTGAVILKGERTPVLRYMV